MEVQPQLQGKRAISIYRLIDYIILPFPEGKSERKTFQFQLFTIIFELVHKETIGKSTLCLFLSQRYNKDDILQDLDRGFCISVNNFSEQRDFPYTYHGYFT